MFFPAARVPVGLDRRHADGLPQPRFLPGSEGRAVGDVERTAAVAVVGTCSGEDDVPSGVSAGEVVGAGQSEGALGRFAPTADGEDPGVVDRDDGGETVGEAVEGRGLELGGVDVGDLGGLGGNDLGDLGAAVSDVGALSPVRSRFDQSADRLIRARWNVEMTAERLRVSTAAAGHLGLAAVVVGVGMTNGGLDAASVTAAVLYVSRITESLSQLPGILTKLQDSAPPTRRLERVLATPPMRDDPDDPIEPDLRGDACSEPDDSIVEFRAVRAASPAGRHPLESCSFTAPRGDWTFLVEPLSGTSAVIVALLVGRLAPAAGLLKIAGFDTTQWRSEFFPTFVASIARDPAEFNATIRDHLTVGGAPDVDDQELQMALDICGLPGPEFDLDRWLGVRERPLGRDDRARLALARAVLHPGPLVVIDDPTERLDSESAAAWWSTARAALEGRSVVVSTRHLETIGSEDRVVALRNGRVLDVGRRADLVVRNGAFSRWWSASAAGVAWTLGTLPGLESLDGAELAALGRRLSIEQFDSGRMVCSVGEAAGSIFIVVDGLVELLDEDGRRRALLRPGDHFGELDPIPGSPPTPAARAVEHAVVSRLHRSSTSSGPVSLLDRPRGERSLFRWLARHGPSTREQIDAAWASVPTVGTHLDSLLERRLVVTEVDTGAPGEARFRVARSIRPRGTSPLLDTIVNWDDQRLSEGSADSAT